MKDTVNEFLLADYSSHIVHRLRSPDSCVSDACVVIVFVCTYLVLIFAYFDEMNFEWLFCLCERDRRTSTRTTVKPVNYDHRRDWE